MLSIKRNNYMHSSNRMAEQEKGEIIFFKGIKRKEKIELLLAFLSCFISKIYGILFLIMKEDLL